MRYLLYLLALASGVVLFSTGSVRAESFNKNRLIEDGLFTEVNSMSVSEIQNFLNKKGGFLADWKDDSDHYADFTYHNNPDDPNSGTTTITCKVHRKTGLTAAQIIHEAATDWKANYRKYTYQYWWNGGYYDGEKTQKIYEREIKSCDEWSKWPDKNLETVSPKALLVTLQKEQSLITATGSYPTNPGAYDNPSCCTNAYKLAWAMGYGVPDTGGKDGKFKGFYNQINWASWQFRFNFERSAGNTDWDDVGYIVYSGPMIKGSWKRCGTCAEQKFDGYYPIDGEALHMENRATASLYYYTPHTYPGYYGNYNFVHFYTDWFGHPLASSKYGYTHTYTDAFLEADHSKKISKNTINVAPGQTVYLKVGVENTGGVTWEQKTLKLAPTKPNDRESIFADSTWIAPSRVSYMEEDVAYYRNRSSFQFSITAPEKLGAYNENFALVIEGERWLKNEIIRVDINVTTPKEPAATNYKLEPGQKLDSSSRLLSQDKYSVLSLSARGKLSLYSDFKQVWGVSKLAGNNAKLIMQGDGNLVLYNESNKAVWHSKTNGNVGAYLTMQTDGNLVIYSSDSKPLWSTQTNIRPNFLKQVEHTLSGGRKLYPGQEISSADRNYRLKYQTDGNLVIYKADVGPVWASYKFTDKPGFLAMQKDGNLVAYNNSLQPYWVINNKGRYSPYLRMQPDGNLVIYSSTNKPLWHTGTHN